MSTFLEWVASCQRGLIVFAMCLSGPSVVLYLAQMATIVRHKQFHNSFYALFSIRAIADLLYVLDSYYGYRVPTLFGSAALPFYAPLPGVVFALFNFLTGFTFHANNLSTIAIFVNRLTAIGYPFKYKEMWRKLLPISALVIYGAPFALNFPLLLVPTTLVTYTDATNKTSFYLQAANDDYLTFAMQVNQLTSVFYLFACALLNGIAFVLYKRQQNKVLNKNSDDKAERKLLVYSVLTFLGHCLNCLLMLSYWFTGTSLELSAAANANYPWVMDIGTVVLSSWLLLWAGDSFRRQMCADFVPQCLAQFIPTGATTNVVPATTVKVSAATPKFTVNLMASTANK